MLPPSLLHNGKTLGLTRSVFHASFNFRFYVSCYISDGKIKFLSGSFDSPEDADSRLQAKLATVLNPTLF